MNQAKKNSSEMVVTYTPEMEEQMAWRLGIIPQLRQDFEQRQLDVWVQPQLEGKT